MYYKQNTYLIYFIKFIFCSFFGLIIISCKKDPKATPEETSTANTIYRSSFLLEQKYSVLSNSLVLNGRDLSGVFTKGAPYTTYYYPYLTKIDSVFFNSKQIKQKPYYWQPYIYYEDTVSQYSLPPFIFRVKGSEEFPSFTEIIPDSIPRFTKYNQLPDSVSLSGNTPIILEGFNANKLGVYINDGISTGLYGINTTPTTTLFTVSTPTFLSVTNSATLTVNYSKVFSKTVSDKTINYEIRSNYEKIIKITP